jgi:hypothetical protein
MSDLQKISRNLAAAQTTYLATADAFEATSWRQRPDPSRWSAAEVTGHLIKVERGVVRKSDQLMHEPARPRPLLKRLHFPMFFVEARLVRRKAPSIVLPETVSDKEEMLAELRDTRERTLAFMQTTSDKDLARYFFPHPFLGTLDVYEWLQLIASHQLRHVKQLREIATFLQKDVANSHK